MKFPGLASVLAACSLAGAASSVLRGSNATVTKAKTDTVLDKAKAAAASGNASALGDMLSAVMAGASKLEEKKAPPARAATSSQPQHGKAKLDVGFTDFEKNLSASVNSSILAAAKEANWSASIRDRLVANVTQEISLGLKSVLKPIKQSIGKTWMALPQDEQKDSYVSQLKSGFESVLDSGSSNIKRHLDIGLHRMNSFTKDMSKEEQEQLLSSCEASLRQGLVGEHCYDDLEPKHSKKVKATNQSAAKKSHSFCIPSTVASLAHRLNDTEGLIGMSMKFEAGALSLAQQAKKEKDSRQARQRKVMM